MVTYVLWEMVVHRAHIQRTVLQLCLDLLKKIFSIETKVLQISFYSMLSITLLFTFDYLPF